MARISLIIIVVGAITLSSVLTSPAIEVAVTQTGGLYADGTADNDASFQNYFVGYGTSSGSPRTPERRSFFIFDLSGISETILLADLSLELTVGGVIFGKDPSDLDDGEDDEEIFELSSTPFTSAEILAMPPAAPPFDAGDIFSTFGTPGAGDPGIGFSEPLADPFVFDKSGSIVPGELIISLNADGIAYLNDNLGGIVVLTGKMASWSEQPEGEEPSELLFGLTDVVADGSPTGFPIPTLDITTVPEPNSIILMLTAGVLLIARRQTP